MDFDNETAVRDAIQAQVADFLEGRESSLEDEGHESEAPESTHEQVSRAQHYFRLERRCLERRCLELKHTNRLESGEAQNYFREVKAGEGSRLREEEVDTERQNDIASSPQSPEDIPGLKVGQGARWDTDAPPAHCQKCGRPKENDVCQRCHNSFCRSCIQMWTNANDEVEIMCDKCLQEAASTHCQKCGEQSAKDQCQRCHNKFCRSCIQMWTNANEGVEAMCDECIREATPLHCQECGRQSTGDECQRCRNKFCRSCIHVWTNANDDVEIMCDECRLSGGIHAESHTPTGYPHQHISHWTTAPLPGLVDSEGYFVDMQHAFFTHQHPLRTYGYVDPSLTYYMYYEQWQRWMRKCASEQGSNPIAAKAGLKAPSQKRITQELKLLGKFAEFRITDNGSTSGKLEGYGLGRWRIVRHHPAPICDREKLDELLDYLLRKEAQYESFNLVSYAMHEGSHEVAQKAYELAEGRRKICMVEIIEGSIKLLMRDKHGCLFLQQVIQADCAASGSAEDREELQRTIVCIFRKLFSQKDIVIGGSNHPNANYVVQAWVRFLQHLPYDVASRERHPLTEFREEVGRNALEIGTEKMGCRVILRLLEEVPVPADILQRLLQTEILESLMTSDGGNYVVQAILERGGVAEKVRLVEHIYDNIRAQGEPNRTFYANHFLARHVLQKSFQICPEPEVRNAQGRAIKLMLKPGGLLRPEYAHLEPDPYVIRAMQDCQKEYIARRGKASAKRYPRVAGRQ